MVIQFQDKRLCKNEEMCQKRKKPGQSQTSQRCGPESQRPPSFLEAVETCLIKSLSKTWSKEQIGQTHKTPAQLMGENGEHKKRVDAEEQKACQKNRKAEKTDQVRDKQGSERAGSRLEDSADKCAQTSGEQLSKSTAGTGR